MDEKSSYSPKNRIIRVQVSFWSLFPQAQKSVFLPRKKRPNLAEQLWKVMILIFEKLVKNEANKSFSAPKMVLERSWVILEQE